MLVDGKAKHLESKSKYIVLTCDVEAFPDKASQKPVDRLIWGKFPGAASNARIETMMDVLDQ